LFALVVLQRPETAFLEPSVRGAAPWASAAGRQAVADRDRQIRRNPISGLSSSRRQARRQTAARFSPW
jgi:hypothetical protein